MDFIPALIYRTSDKIRLAGAKMEDFLKRPLQRSWRYGLFVVIAVHVSPTLIEAQPIWTVHRHPNVFYFLAMLSLFAFAYFAAAIVAWVVSKKSDGSKLNQSVSWEWLVWAITGFVAIMYGYKEAVEQQPEELRQAGLATASAIMVWELAAFKMAESTAIGLLAI